MYFIARFVPRAATEFRNMGVRCGSVVAAGESILSVCSGELIDDGRCKSGDLEFPPPYLGNSSKGDAQLAVPGGNLRP